MSSKSPPNPIVFSVEQRNQLERLKVPPRTIHELENIALPIAKLFLSKPAPVTPIRHRIEKVRKPLRKAHNELSKLLGPSPKTADAKLAKLLILNAACSQSSMTEALMMVERLGKTVAVFDSAIDVLSEQARNRVHPRPVEEIHEERIGILMADGIAKPQRFRKQPGNWNTGVAGSNSRPTPGS